MKRASPDSAAQDASKRQKLNNGDRIKTSHLQPGLRDALDEPQNPEIFDRQIDKTLGILLKLVGFDAVKKDALESLRFMMQEHMTRLCNNVSRAMLDARRVTPAPADCALALREMNIRVDSLDRELSAKAPSSVTQRRILRAPEWHSTAPAFEHREYTLADKAFARSEKGHLAEQRKRWLPRGVPDFPPIHTYRQTPVMVERETDARKVIDLSTNEGKGAEQALRRLVNGKKALQRRTPKRDHGELGRKNDDAFEDTMKALMGDGASSQGFGFGGASGEPPGRALEDKEAGANGDQKHWRLSAARGLLGVS